MIKTAVVQAGNSDDKLSQVEWSEYVKSVGRLVDTYSDDIHFSGGPTTAAKWQNFCWVFTISKSKVQHFLETLKIMRERYSQDSIAVIIGDAEFI